MTPGEVVIISQDLSTDEGVRLFVYDDDTGLPIKPGTLVKGHPTIGVGRALDVHGISGAESNFLLADDVGDFLAEINASLPWFAGLDFARRRVIFEMCFNMGVYALLKFKKFLAAVQTGDYETAKAEMLNTPWAKQVGKRADKLAGYMVS